MAEWTDAEIVRLRALWHEVPVLSTSEIGRRMGRPKNAVVGKAHRSDLEPRPSPIRREAGQFLTRQRVAAMRPVGSTLPPLTSAAALPPPDPKPPALGTSRFECVYPMGEPGTKTFQYCGEPAQLGSPYCETHHKRCFVKPTRQEHAAA